MNYFKIRKFRETKFRGFAIFFSKFVKAWNSEIFDLVALVKVNSSLENVQFVARESFFLRKIFFFFLQKFQSS